MTFSIDPGILDAYRRRGAAALAAGRAIDDERQAIRRDLGDLLNRERRLAETHDRLHPSEIERRSKLESDLQRCLRDGADAEAATAYASGVFGRLTAYAKEVSREH